MAARFPASSSTVASERSSVVAKRETLLSLQADVRALSGVVSGLRLEVDDHKKKFDYATRAREELRGKAAAARRMPRSEASGAGTKLRRVDLAAAEDAAEDAAEALEGLREGLESLRGRKAALGARRDAADAAAKVTSAALDEALATLARAAQRRSAALAGEDDDAPWRRARAPEQSASAGEVGGGDGGGDAFVLEDLRARLAAAERDATRSAGGLARRRALEGAWRTCCLEFLRAGHVDAARRDAYDLGRAVRRAKSAGGARRHGATARAREDAFASRAAFYDDTHGGDWGPSPTAA